MRIKMDVKTLGGERGEVEKREPGEQEKEKAPVMWPTAIRTVTAPNNKKKRNAGFRFYTSRPEPLCAMRYLFIQLSNWRGCTVVCLTWVGNTRK